MVASLDSTSGIGYSYGHCVAAMYLQALLCETVVVPFNDGKIVEVSLEQKVFEADLDDIVVCAEDNNNEITTFNIQVKKSLTLPTTSTLPKKENKFYTIIQDAWRDLQKSRSEDSHIIVGAIVNEISDSSYNAFQQLIHIANSHTNSTDFRQVVNSSATQRITKTLLKNIEYILKDAFDVEECGYSLCKHFSIIRLDLGHATDNSAQYINNLKNLLHTDDAHKSTDLWAELQRLAKDHANGAVKFNRNLLLSKLAGYRFTPAYSYKNNIKKFIDFSLDNVKSITPDTAGFTLPRTSYLEEAKQFLASDNRLLYITGAPGTGKSAIIRAIADNLNEENSNPIFLSEHILGQETTWATFSHNLGIENNTFEEIFLNFGKCNSPILMIDGLDRLTPQQQVLINSFINKIFENSLLKDWKVIATLRDNRENYVGNWLKHKADRRIEIKEYDDQDAENLAKQFPSLKQILYAENKAVKSFARRPFFTRILVEYVQKSGGLDKIHTEIDLVNVWWAGFAIQTPRERQNALLTYAKAIAKKAGDGIRSGADAIASLNDTAVNSLIYDGTIKINDKKSTHRFAHDIFFEWAFYKLLLEKSDDTPWYDVVKDAGEMPMLARSVELLGQYRFCHEPEQWQQEVLQLKTTTNIRPQWLRVWLLAPLSLTSFIENERYYNEVIFDSESPFYQNLFVWLEAEKTVPNPLITESITNIDAETIADYKAWPDNILNWYRFLSWLLRNIEQVSIENRVKVLPLFKIWLNLGDYHTIRPLSERILTIVNDWLYECEYVRHITHFSEHPKGWRNYSEAFEHELRLMLLLNAPIVPALVTSYLKRVTETVSLQQAFADICSVAHHLSLTHPAELVDLTLAVALDDLPNDRKPQEYSFMTLDNEREEQLGLAKRYDEYNYFPASAIYEPFKSLLQHAPAHAVNLIKSLSNHATEAWKQYRAKENTTPLPLCLNFPWGDQQFWGDERMYRWFRGDLGPNILICAYMALEVWLHNEIEVGKDIDAIIEQVLKGNECVGMLGIVVAIVLETQHVSPLTTQLVTNQRLWRYDRQRRHTETLSYYDIGYEDSFTYYERLEHRKLLEISKSRSCRSTEIRQMTVAFMLKLDESARTAVAREIQNFPANLPYEYEHELQDATYTQELKKDAIIWAEDGKPENYRIIPQEKPDTALVVCENPELLKPEIIETLQKYENDLIPRKLWSWANDILLNGKPAYKLDLLEQAIENAKSLDHKSLFKQQKHTTHFANLVPSAVAGVAAVVVTKNLDGSKENTLWANKILCRAALMPSTHNNLNDRDNPLFSHPAIFAAHGFRVLAQAADNQAEEDKAALALLKLVNHYSKDVGIAALEQILKCWKTNRSFSLIALNLALKNCVTLQNNSSSSIKDELRQHHINFKESVKDFKQGNVISHFTSPPKAWVNEARTKWKDYPFKLSENDKKPHWRRPDLWYNEQYLAKIVDVLIKTVPIEDILSTETKEPFLAWCDELLGYLLELLAPSWKETNAQLKERDKFHKHYQINNVISNLLSVLVINLTAEEFEERYLNVIIKQRDAVFTFLLDSLVQKLMCTYVCDAQTIPEQTIPIITIFIERLLQHEDFASAHYNDRFYDDNIMPIIRTLFIANFNERAMLAVRFANDDWHDVTLIQPLQNAIIQKAGWIPDIATFFLTVVEKSKRHYDFEIFVEQALSIATQLQNLQTFQNGYYYTKTCVEWRAIAIPARMSRLLQDGLMQWRLENNDVSVLRNILIILDILINLGDRRSAALQSNELFRNIR